MFSLLLGTVKSPRFWVTSAVFHQIPIIRAKMPSPVLEAGQVTKKYSFFLRFVETLVFADVHSARVYVKMGDF